MSTPSTPTPGTAYVLARVWGRTDQKEFSNDFWYSVTAGTFDPAVDGSAAATALYTAINVPIAAALSTDFILRGLTALLNNGSLAITTPYYFDTSGGVSGRCMPDDVAVVVQKLTETPGKDGRGRWYFTGVPITYTDDSYLNPTGVAAYEALAIALKTAVTFTATAGSVTLSPAHFSRKTRLLYPIKNDPVVGLLGTKRRRRGPF